jgi:hypothetical protein
VIRFKKQLKIKVAIYIDADNYGDQYLPLHVRNQMIFKHFYFGGNLWKQVDQTNDVFNNPTVHKIKKNENKISISKNSRNW